MQGLTIRDYQCIYGRQRRCTVCQIICIVHPVYPIYGMLYCYILYRVTYHDQCIGLRITDTTLAMRINTSLGSRDPWSKSEGKGLLDRRSSSHNKCNRSLYCGSTPIKGVQCRAVHFKRADWSIYTFLLPTSSLLMSSAGKRVSETLPDHAYRGRGRGRGGWTPRPMTTKRVKSIAKREDQRRDDRSIMTRMKM